MKGQITMAKYDIYKNKRNHFHPSIEVQVDEEHNWFNYEITDSPRAGETYQLLHFNPNRLISPDKPALVRKYLRKDKLRHRGKLLKNYVLFPEDISLINKMLFEREQNIEKGKKKNGVKRLNHGNGNQASLHKREESPFASIKAHRKRKHNRRMKKREKMEHDKTKK